MKLLTFSFFNNVDCSNINSYTIVTRLSILRVVSKKKLVGGSIVSVMLHTGASPRHFTGINYGDCIKIFLSWIPFTLKLGIEWRNINSNTYLFTIHDWKCFLYCFLPEWHEVWCSYRLVHHSMGCNFLEHLRDLRKNMYTVNSILSHQSYEP